MNHAYTISSPCEPNGPGELTQYKRMNLVTGLIPRSGSEVKKLFSCSTQLRLKFILFINVKMLTIVVGILTFMSRINSRFW